MFYWLFTEGRAVLGGCLAPLLCLIPLDQVIAAALMGASYGAQTRKSNTVWDHVVRLLAHLSVLRGFGVYFTLIATCHPAHRVPQLTRGSHHNRTVGPSDNSRGSSWRADGGMVLGVGEHVLHDGLRRVVGWQRVDRLRRPASSWLARLLTFRTCANTAFYRRQAVKVEFLGAFWVKTNALGLCTGTFP